MSVKNRPPLPAWLRVKTNVGSERKNISQLLDAHALNTVCKSAKCPNLAECWHGKIATFMILGNACTRNCKFCAVNHSATPEPLNVDEPQKVADAAKDMGLKFVVVTSVTRDDLHDEGAGAFAQTIQAIKTTIPSSKVEVLTPDFNVNESLLRIVLDASPDVFNHNIETVERITPLVRYRATYQNSLKVLRFASENYPHLWVKSGLMVGLGETNDEIIQTIKDLFVAGCRILTIGQYLPPTAEAYVLDRYVEPAQFDLWKKFALDLGFTSVASGPLVRSSYQAHKLVH